MSDTNKIKSLVENLQKKRENEPLNTSEENKDLVSMLENLTTQTSSNENADELIENGLIGNLAKELSQDINLDDLNLNVDDENANRISRTFFAGRTAGSMFSIFCSSAASRISSHISRSLLLAAPSVPKPTFIPALSIFMIGAIPAPVFIFEVGL